MNIDEFWDSYSISLYEKNQTHNILSQFLSDRRAMSNTLLDSNLKLPNLYEEALLFNLNFPYSEDSYKIDDINAYIREKHFDAKQSERYHKICEDIGEGTGEMKIIAQAVGAACAGYGNQQSSEDNFVNYVWAIHGLGIDFSLFLSNLLYFSSLDQ
ncbi:hypothetical protein MF271_22345 (plasmid) [Deinococcus sp. KNUC1210]|uniref:hypothetical protein n=1 Tax=Deinococcus sp. KNUC1210 TaxID=2917691 RepID=UPI001EF02AF3|nr:hypothetical protein [Deinococcus sp. KNUC1210]ULH18213.1 hypothetical protein MF271_22345 [Deinococcus sp. KNUC1210]